MSERTLVTSALIYANGSIHIGHLVEYIQTDIFVRAMKLMGEDIVYVCADDTHGTPIELNSAKEGISPEKFIARYYEEHVADFKLYDVEFDCFHSTNSPENKHYTEKIYQTIKDKGGFEYKDVDGYYCEHDKRFLPDRFIKGICPKCKASDQYGDVCEVCGATYEPTELSEPYCSICHNTPVIKRSRHIFFSLKQHSEFLQSWTEKSLMPETAKFVQKWIKDGLKAWCISRNGPYFGFKIPDEQDKYFYVWFDAPIGYIAATEKYCQTIGSDAETRYWKADTSNIIHVIGKDIVYFHSLFWPAVLKSAAYNLPKRVQVHGFLTVNGEKMSKSRGTFITARDFADHADPEFLRYFYAAHLSNRADDLDLNFEEFQNRINAELANKIANLIHRTANFVNKQFEGKLSAFSIQDYPELTAIEEKLSAIKDHFRNFEFNRATREICAIADIGNLYFQEHKPWEIMASDPKKAQQVCTYVAHICQAVLIGLKPIVPRFVEKAEQVLNISAVHFDTPLWQLGGHKLNPARHIMQRFDRKKLEAFVAQKASKDAPAEQTGNKKSSPEKSKTQKAAKNSEQEQTALIDIKDFMQVDLRVGKVLSAEALPKSKKLLKTMVDIGEAEPRQVLAGIALSYAPEELVGKTVVVVANLKPAKLMGHESQGMLLAVGDKPDNVNLLSVADDKQPGEKVS